MLPSVVIGLGGTGKWVLTDLKKSILEVNDGVMPDNVVLLAFDLEGQGTPSTERLVFNFKEGKAEKFALDYSSENTPEFYNFSGFWAKPIFDIKEGNGNQHEFIYRWLKEDDAESYALGGSELHSKEGAGQRRQTSRVSLFLHSDNIYQKIYQAVLKVGEALRGQTMQIFVVASLAGGTGCGTFIDISYLIYKSVIEKGIEATPKYLYGFFILPRGFEAIAPTSKDRQLMESNCFAAFRELQRFMAVTNITIDFSNTLRGIGTGDVRLFDICYLIDGSRVAGESGSKFKHYESTCPALADFILLHMTEGMAPTTENRNLVTHIGGQIQSAEDPSEAQIYSTFGIYTYIFDVEEVKKTFAHRLASQVLSHFLDASPKGETEIKSEVQDFMKNQANTPFNREFVGYLLEHPGAIRPLKNVLFNYIRFGIRDEDMLLPPLQLSDIPTRSLLHGIPFDQVKRTAQARIDANIGGEGDVASPRSSVGRSYYGVLNYYHQAHQEKFKRFLKEEVIGILHQDYGRGGLDHASKFLCLLASAYERFIQLISEAYEKEQVEDKINQANDNMNKCEKNTDQKGYLKAAATFAEHRQHQLVMSYVIKIAQSHRDLCKDFQQQILDWIGTFKLGLEHVQRASREHYSVRIDKMGIKVREYVTQPDDQWENRLYDLILGRAQPKDEIETVLNKKLPHPDLSAVYGNFRWMFDHPDAGPDKLTCTLPDEFLPLRELRERPILWNYNFVNNFLEKGQFHALSNLSIMDILAWKRVNPDKFVEEIMTKASPLAEVSLVEQQRGALGEGDQRVTANWTKTFAKWTVDEPGRSFAQGLEAKFEDRPPGYDNPHRIIQYQARHFIRMRGFINLLNTERAYRQNQKKKKREPVHVFLAEKNAAKYEEKLEEILNEKIRCLHPVVVNLLEYEEWVKDFTFAVVYGIIPRRTIEGRYCYAYDVEIRGQTETIKLGENYLDAILKFISADSEAEAVRKDVRREVRRLKDEKASNPRNFADELKAHFNNTLKAGDGGSRAENDLVKVMRIILWEEATYYDREARSR
jgi:hypothetical protein